MLFERAEPVTTFRASKNENSKIDCCARDGAARVGSSGQMKGAARHRESDEACCGRTNSTSLTLPSLSRSKASKITLALARADSWGGVTSRADTATTPASTVSTLHFALPLIAKRSSTAAPKASSVCDRAIVIACNDTCGCA